MDTIDAKITVYDERLHTITLILNGEDVPGNFDPMEFIISPLYKKAKFELMTCGCGEAGCAGIFDGTVVKNRRYTVEWRDIDCGLPKRFYSFDKREYAAMTEKVIMLMREIAKAREELEITRNRTYDGVLEFYTIEDCEDSIRWRYNYHKKLQNSKEFLQHWRNVQI